MANINHAFQRQRPWSGLAFDGVCAVCVLAALVFCSWRLAGLPELRFDAEIYYYALKKFDAFGMLYNRGDGGLTTPELLFRPASPIYKFPPLYLAWLLPIHHSLTLDEFYLSYCALQLLCYLVLAFCVIVVIRQYVGLKQAAWITAVIFLLSFPFYEVLRATSVELFVLTWMMVAFVVANRFPRCAGVLLAYLALIKIYPAFMLLYFVLQKQWKVLEGSLYGGLLLVILSVILFGWQEHFYYLTTVLPVLLDETVSLKDENLNLLASMKNHLDESLLNQCFQAWRVLVLACLLAVCWRAPAVPGNRLLLFVFFTVVMQLMLPNYWVWYQVYLQLPAVLVLVLCWKRQQYALVAVGVVLAFILIQDPLWYDQVMRHSAVFQSQPEAYWAEVHKQQGVAILKTISPVAYGLYGMSQARFLLLPAYFLLLLYLLLTPQRTQRET